jgi:ABC-type transporter Mla subunit MlaD
VTHTLFRADLDALDALAGALVRAEQSLQDALDALHATTAAAIGTDVLDRACDDFQQHWRYGLKQIRQQADDIAAGVRTVSGGYAEAERGVVAALAAAGGLPVPVPGGGR